MVNIPFIGNDDRVGLVVADTIETRERTGHYAEGQHHMTPDFLRALLYEAWCEGKKAGALDGALAVLKAEAKPEDAEEQSHRT